MPMPSFETVSSGQSFQDKVHAGLSEPSVFGIIEYIPTSHVLGSVCANEYVKYLISMSQCLFNMNN